MSKPSPSLQETAQLTRAATVASVGVAVVLLAVKGAAWFVSGSVAVMASTADSALDLLASMATFFAVRYAAAPPDAEHRFGHGKAEAFASLLQAGLVFASAALIAQEAIRHLARSRPVAHEAWAIASMVASIVLTAALVSIQTRILRDARSVAVSADRMHYVTDLASNVIALLGVGASSLLALPAIDAAGGLCVAGLLLWGAVAVFREAADQLMDHELPDDARATIIDLATADAQVVAVNNLRTRASGPTVHIQMNASLAHDLTLEEAHKVVLATERRILAGFPGADIIIHADPHGRAEPHAGAFAQARS
jgi:cation diffusion facilitator family transporter